MILLVTGGSASGKSEYAENRALQLAKTEQKKLIYLAAMKPFGEEAAKRIERHRQLRAGKGFETVERYTDIEGLCRNESLEAETFRQKAKDAVVLLECMSNLAANEMFSGSDSNADCTGEFERMDTSRVKDRIMRGIDALTEVSDHLVIVSINVFEEGMQQYDAWTRAYMQCLGELNQALTRKADTAVEVVYSIPVPYKEGLTCNL